MANYLEEGQACHDTNKGGNNNDTKIVKWLRSNNLKHVIPIFEQESITLDELISLAEDASDLSFLKEYLHALQIPTPSITRICSKIKRLLHDRNNNIVSHSPMIRVVLSVEEEEATKQLTEYSAHISRMIRQLRILNETVTQNEAKIKSNIDTAFSKMIKAITDKQRSLVSELHTISEHKHSVIDAKLEQLQKNLKLADDTMKSCDKLLESAEIDKSERKGTILYMVNTIINRSQKMREKEQQITNHVLANTVFQFSPEKIQKYVSNVGLLNGSIKGNKTDRDLVQINEDKSRHKKYFQITEERMKRFHTLLHNTTLLNFTKVVVQRMKYFDNCTQTPFAITTVIKYGKIFKNEKTLVYAETIMPGLPLVNLHHMHDGEVRQRWDANVSVRKQELYRDEETMLYILNYKGKPKGSKLFGYIGDRPREFTDVVQVSMAENGNVELAGCSTKYALFPKTKGFVTGWTTLDAYKMTIIDPKEATEKYKLPKASNWCTVQCMLQRDPKGLASSNYSVSFVNGHIVNGVFKNFAQSRLYLFAFNQMNVSAAKK